MAFHGIRLWTEQQVNLLIELREDEGMEWPDIAVEIGFSANQCRDKYYQIEARHRASCGLSPKSNKASNAQLIDRERREHARDGASLTARLFGDPPPGFSALDRRRASA